MGASAVEEWVGVPVWVWEGGRVWSLHRVKWGLCLQLWVPGLDSAWWGSSGSLAAAGRSFLPLCTQRWRRASGRVLGPYCPSARSGQQVRKRAEEQVLSALVTQQVALIQGS